MAGRGEQARGVRTAWRGRMAPVPVPPAEPKGVRAGRSAPPGGGHGSALWEKGSGPAPDRQSYARGPRRGSALWEKGSGPAPRGAVTPLRPQAERVRVLPREPWQPATAGRHGSGGPGDGRSGGAAAGLAPRPARRRWRLRWGRLVATAVAAYLLAGLILQQWALWQAQKDLRALDRQLQQLRSRAVELESARRRVEDPAYVDETARRRLGLVQPGETVIQLVDEPGGSD